MNTTPQRMRNILAVIMDEFTHKLHHSHESNLRLYHFLPLKDKAHVAIGMRRTGKTYLLLQKIRELLHQKIPLSQILYLNFEDDRLLPADKDDLATLIDAFYQIHPENHERR